MTYGVGLKLRDGLVFMSDTRTNAGLDNISRFRKINTWEVPGERAITLLSAGNLATTQAVVSRLDERTKAVPDRSPSILEAPTMFQIANLVGNTLRAEIAKQKEGGPEAASTFDATLILGGQIRGIAPRLFMIYPEGNFIEACDDTPFFQIGETKYGRPILVRAFDPAMPVADAIKLLCLSFDSTIRANLSVGMPLDIQVIHNDALQLGPRYRIEEHDSYFAALAEAWAEKLRAGVSELPAFPLG